MPGDNCFRCDDGRDLPPCGPYTTQQNPKYPILDLQPSARMLSLQYGQLLTKRKDSKAGVVPKTEEGAEAGEQASEEWNHGLGHMAQVSIKTLALST
jgi:hypothetical protein